MIILGTRDTRYARFNQEVLMAARVWGEDTGLYRDEEVEETTNSHGFGVNPERPLEKLNAMHDLYEDPGTLVLDPKTGRNVWRRPRANEVINRRRMVENESRSSHLFICIAMGILVFALVSILILQLGFVKVYRKSPMHEQFQNGPTYEFPLGMP